jgi:hypothetical protein
MGEPFNFLFTEAVSEDETTYGTGSRCVGISAVSQKIQKPGGGSINIDLAETFGLNGTPLDFTKLVFGLNRRVYIPSYGSQSSAIYSMGGTALHCMVWDDWPAQLTVFVPQYFCVMHFNPGVLGDTCGRLDYNIDFYEPSDGDGTVVGPADSVSLSVNNSRRGQMVTGGFKYYQKSIGYSLGSYDIEFAGRNFLVGDLAYDRGNGSIIEVTSVDGNGGITGFSFSTDEEGNLTRGEFLSPEVLEAPVIYSSNNSTASARIKFNQGIITKYTKVEGPRQRVSVRRLSTTADGTLGRVYGTKNNTIALPQNNDAPEPGSYQIFYLFHSDAMVNPRVDGVDNKGIVQIAHITVTVT